MADGVKTHERRAASAPHQGQTPAVDVDPGDRLLRADGCAEIRVKLKRRIHGGLHL